MLHHFVNCYYQTSPIKIFLYSFVQLQLGSLCRHPGTADVGRAVFFLPNSSAMWHGHPGHATSHPLLIGSFRFHLCSRSGCSSFPTCFETRCQHSIHLGSSTKDPLKKKMMGILGTMRSTRLIGWTCINHRKRPTLLSPKGWGVNSLRLLTALQSSKGA